MAAEEEDDAEYLEVACSHCKQTLEVPADMRDEIVECPECKTHIRVPCVVRTATGRWMTIRRPSRGTV